MLWLIVQFLTAFVIFHTCEAVNYNSDEYYELERTVMRKVKNEWGVLGTRGTLLVNFANYDFDSNNKITTSVEALSTIDVPFTPEEVKLIETLRKTVEKYVKTVKSVKEKLPKVIRQATDGILKNKKAIEPILKDFFHECDELIRNYAGHCDEVFTAIVDDVGKQLNDNFCGVGAIKAELERFDKIATKITSGINGALDNVIKDVYANHDHIEDKSKFYWKNQEPYVKRNKEILEQAFRNLEDYLHMYVTSSACTKTIPDRMKHTTKILLDRMKCCVNPVQTRRC